jgi:hypothetical protein
MTEYLLLGGVYVISVATSWVLGRFGWTNLLNDVKALKAQIETPKATVAPV